MAHVAALSAGAAGVPLAILAMGVIVAILVAVNVAAMARTTDLTAATT